MEVVLVLADEDVRLPRVDCFSAYSTYFCAKTAYGVSRYAENAVASVAAETFRLGCHVEAVHLLGYLLFFCFDLHVYHVDLALELLNFLRVVFSNLLI